MSPIYLLLLDEDGSSYTLPNEMSTSAGVYDADGNLLRTLWSGVIKPAGYHETPAWDGLDDYDADVFSRGVSIKVVANNIHAEWDGIIGNSSKNFEGEGVHSRYDTPKDMLIIGNMGYFSHDYSERHGSVSGIDLNDYQHKLEVQETLKVYPATTHLAYDGNMLFMAGRGGECSH